MKRTVFILISISTFLCGIKAQEYRGGVSAEFSILPRFEGEAGIELRKIFIPESYFNRTFQCSFKYELTGRWSIGTTYSYAIITEKENQEERSVEAFDRHRLVIDLDYQAKRFGNDLRISNRFRYQVSTADEHDTRQYFRNRVMLDYKISSLMNPYLALEPYYRFDENRVNAVRFYLGNELPVLGSKIDLYYIAEVHLEPEYTTAQYIIGLTLELDFK